MKRILPKGKCGLVAYVTCGDPDLDTTVAVVRELVSAGADAIELGVPFSDPIADGPVIQAAAHRALERGTTMRDVFHVASQLKGVPLIAFSYLNPVMRYGFERFAADAAAAGFSAALLTDLPPEAAKDVRRALHAQGLGLVHLLAPTSSDERAKLIDRASDQFVYYVSTTGVTGTRRELDPSLIGRLREIRAIVKKPLAVGFGVSEREHYLALRDDCDAVVVGSAIVRAIGDGDAAGAPKRAGDVVRRILA